MSSLQQKGSALEVPQLRFDEVKHEYWLGPIQLPTVTGILDRVGLVSPFAKNADAAKRGQHVHTAGRYLLEKRLDWSTVGMNIMGYVVSLDRWIEATRFEVEACEVMVYHRFLMFAGTFDLKGYLPKYGKCLFDMKTGQHERWHCEQTAGYELANGGHSKRGCLHLQKNGSMAKFVEHRDRSDRAMFVSCLNVYRRLEAL